MGERTEHAPGTFSWADLGTTEPEGAKAFYTALFGWEAEERPIPDGGVYTMLRQGGLEVAALYGQRQEGVPPSWLSYVTVADADAAAARAREVGGTLMSEPFDVMEVGRMAVVQDPQGAVLALWQPGQSIGARLVNDPGAMSLNQLNAASPELARRFYSDLFGWRFEEMSDDPPYWGIYNGERVNGGMMPLPAEAEGPSHWLVYFSVSDLDAAAAKIGELDGTVVVAPRDVPGGRILVARDPQGAHFALWSGRTDD
jgi:predicted enzyme related to lactoylglutathione lyase